MNASGYLQPHCSYPPLAHPSGEERTVVGHHVNGWLPRNRDSLQNWLDKKIAFVEHPSRQHQALHPVVQEFQRLIEMDAVVYMGFHQMFEQALHPVVQEFQRLIEMDAVVYMGFHQMFEQVPNKPPYDKDPTGKPQVRDYKLMLKLFDHIIQVAPEYESHGFVGFPINAILDWPMGTPAGVAMFSSPSVNTHFKKMFAVWSDHLSSEASCAVLNDSDNGWFGPPARAALANFDQTFVCEPKAPFHGFTSWDDFFTRRFRPGVRPVHCPDDEEVVNSACESTVYRIAYNARERDRFWLKGEPYSLAHMLDSDEDAQQFIGGTVYQAYLSPTDYHRWHSSVDGRIVRVVAVPGTYYAESPSHGFPHPDATAPCLSQAFLASVATRTLIYIEADNPTIGTMVFMGVGMSEVSTCEATVKAGDRVSKGDEIGMFHYGGSTHCLIFRREVKVAFGSDVLGGKKVKVNAPIARVSTA